MIKVNKLSFSYDKKKEFIKDLSFNIEKGKITTILVHLYLIKMKCINGSILN